MNDNSKKKKLIMVDLDGVLNEYKGKFDVKIIPEIRNEAAEFVKKLNENYDLKLFTTRNKEHAQKWLKENNIDKYFSAVTNIKEPCIIHIDDRCITFKGDYNDTIDKVQNFKVWYK